MEIINGGLSVDDRGKLTFVNAFPDGIKRFYVVENHKQGFVRAWHGHRKEGKYVFVVTGAAIVGVVSMEDENIDRVVLSSDKPQILYIPPGYYNGFKTLTDDTQVVFFSTTTLEESEGDDYRKPADTWDMFGVVER